MIRRALLCALAAVGLASCGPYSPRPVRLDFAEWLLSEGRFEDAAREFQKTLAGLKGREADYETLIAQVRIHLRFYEEREAFEQLPATRRGAFRSGMEHLALAARAAAELIAGLSPPAHRQEAARAAARIYALKAENPALCLFTKDTVIGAYLLRRIAESFEAHCPEEKLTAPSREIALILSNRAETCEDYRTVWRLLAAEERGGASDRAFAELPIERHLQQGTQAQDLGTREAAARGDPKQVLQHYIEALTHLTLVRECTLNPTVGEKNALGAIGLLYSTVERLELPDD